MRKTGVLLMVASLALSACGGGGDGGGSAQAELAELMLAEDEFGFTDEQCIRDKTNELSDKDAQILIDNIDAEDTEDLGLSTEAELWVFSLLECFGDLLGDDSAESAATVVIVEGAPDGVEGDKSSPVPPGAIADIGDGWRLQVLDVAEDGTAAVMEEAEYNDPPADGSRFTLVTVALGYFGSDDSIVPFIGALAAENVELESYCGGIPNELDMYNDIFAGGVIVGNLCWVTTPADAGLLELYATSGFSGSDVFLDAGSAPDDPTVMTPLRGVQDETESADERLSPIALGTPTDVGDRWQLTLTGPARDITDAVLAENDYNEPPPDGYRFVGIEVTMDYGGDESANGFDVTVQMVGDSNVALNSNCGTVPGEIDRYSDIFGGGSVDGTLCFVAPAEDIGTLVAYANTGFSDDYSYFATE